MILNLLRFSFKDGISEDAKRRALEAISRTAKLEPVAFSVVGQDLGNAEDGYTHSYCVGVSDLAALDRYLSDPIHREGDFVFAPVVAKLWRTASSDDTSANLRDTIAAMYGEKMAADPEWSKILRSIPDIRI